MPEGLAPNKLETPIVKSRFRIGVRQLISVWRW